MQTLLWHPIFPLMGSAISPVMGRLESKERFQWLTVFIVTMRIKSLYWSSNTITLYIGEKEGLYVWATGEKILAITISQKTQTFNSFVLHKNLLYQLILLGESCNDEGVMLNKLWYFCHKYNLIKESWTDYNPSALDSNVRSGCWLGGKCKGKISHTCCLWVTVWKSWQ